MYIPLKIGEATTILDPTIGGPITVLVTAIENGGAEITVSVPPDVPVTKVREATRFVVISEGRRV